MDTGTGVRLDGAVIFDYGARTFEAGSVIERSIIRLGALNIGYPRALISATVVIGDGAHIGGPGSWSPSFVAPARRSRGVARCVHIPDGGIRYSTDV